MRSESVGMIRPVGAKMDKAVDLRLIAATNVDLRKAVNAGFFREDLLQRLEVFPIFLPPLRQHLRDLPMLAYHYLDTLNQTFSLTVEDIAPETMAILLGYTWPGNIRELKNVIAEAVVMAETGLLKPEHLPARITAQAHASDIQAFTATMANTGLEGPVLPHPVPLVSWTTTDMPNTTNGVYIPLGTSLEEVQKTYVVKTLNYCSNNKTHAARVLGVSRKTLYDKLLRWGIAVKQQF